MPKIDVMQETKAEPIAVFNINEMIDQATFSSLAEKYKHHNHKDTKRDENCLVCSSLITLEGGQHEIDLMFDGRSGDDNEGVPF